MLIVSKTDSGSAYLKDISDILLVMLGKKRVTDAKSILMTGNAAKRILLAVKDKATLGIDLEGTAAEARAYVINDLVTLNYLYLTAVEVRVAPAVPEVNVLYSKGHLGVCGNYLLDLIFVLVVDGVSDLLTVSKVLYEYLNVNLCVIAVYGGGDHKTLAAVVLKVKVRLADADNAYVTVKTAVEGEVCNLGINGLVRLVVYSDCKGCLLADLAGKVNSPGGITAVVVCKLLTVNVHVCGGVSARDIKVVAIALGKIALLNSLYVNAGAAEIIVSAVLAVDSVPGVGQVNALPIGGECGGDIGGLIKEPALVNVN